MTTTRKHGSLAALISEQGVAPPMPAAPPLPRPRTAVLPRLRPPWRPQTVAPGLGLRTYGVRRYGVLRNFRSTSGWSGRTSCCGRTSSASCP